MQKIPCTKCGALILPGTAQKNGGVCMPCNTGTRDAIEQSKVYHKEQRELDRTDPQRLFWKSLVHRVHRAGGGFETLSEAEKKYFALNILLGEVYNGGFDQFFHNHSGEYYLVVSQTLLELGAQRTLRLLREAKEILFPGCEVPLNTRARRQHLASQPAGDSGRLEELDKEFWSDPDSLYEKLSVFAAAHKLLA